jgi:hypothetical protein
MDTNIWLPFAALVLGWGLAQLGDLLKDRRTSDRERLARRAELQRSTLLNVQDALLELSTAAQAARDADGLAQAAAKAAVPGGNDRSITAWQERQRMWRAKAAAQMLCSRVEDEQTRRLAESAIAAALRLVPYDAATHDEVYGRVNDSYRLAVDRLGELLRERY